ncbi:MAG: hypothetical protein ACI4S3_05075 [Candidatus Gastranaerophilaceae bacterium]
MFAETPMFFSHILTIVQYKFLYNNKDFYIEACAILNYRDSSTSTFSFTPVASNYSPNIIFHYCT